MCGVWGIVKDYPGVLSDAQEKFIRNCALAGQVRGEDGFGIMVVYEGGQCKAFKGVGTPNEIMRTDGFYNLFYTFKQQGKKTVAVPKKIKMVFGHNRAATKGTVTAKNAHPFRDGNIILMHNGTLSNVLPEGFEVDSKWAAHLFKTEESIDAVEDKVNGAYVFIWYNQTDKKLRILSNGQRPLHQINGATGRYYASEKGMLEWIYERCNKSSVKSTATLVPSHVVLEHDHKEMGVKEVTTKKRQSSTNGTTTNSGGTRHGGSSNAHSVWPTNQSRTPPNRSSSYFPTSSPGVVRSENNGSSQEKARSRFFYREPFPNTVSFKLRYAPYYSDLHNKQKIMIAIGENSTLGETKNILIASKFEIHLKTGITYFASVLGYTIRNGITYLLADPSTIYEDRSDPIPKKATDATGQVIPEDIIEKKPQCLSCNIPVERHELQRAYLIKEGLICEDCADSYIPRQNSLDSYNSNVYNIRQ